MIKKTIGAVAAAAIGSATYYYWPASEYPFHLYINGSENVPHDIGIGDQYNGNVDYDLYCKGATMKLINAAAGDIVFSARAGGYKCNFDAELLPTIAIMGGSNSPEYFGARKMENALVVSNGKLYGKGVDYFIGFGNLGDEYVMFANMIAELNAARINSGIPPADVRQLRGYFNKSSSISFEQNGRYYGKIIDLEKAIELATAPTSTPVFKPATEIVQAITYLLLE